MMTILKFKSLKTSKKKFSKPKESRNRFCNRCWQNCISIITGKINGKSTKEPKLLKAPEMIFAFGPKIFSKKNLPNYIYNPLKIKKNYKMNRLLIGIIC